MKGEWLSVRCEHGPAGARNALAILQKTKSSSLGIVAVHQTTQAAQQAALFTPAAAR
jgi:hypothetical protein